MKRENETTRGYYIHEHSAEWDAVERWENEGGKLRQKREYVYDSAARRDPRHLDRATPIRRSVNQTYSQALL